MAEYIAGYCTDTGIQKKINQDSLCIRRMIYQGEQMLLAVVCDGMGGLSKGEMASAETVHCFAESFVKEIPKKAMEDGWKEVKKYWKEQIEELNTKFLEYKKETGIVMGTTISALFLMKDQYMAVQVGDSRIYRLSGEPECITEDQSVIAREIKLGHITEEEALHDTRKNILLECIGVTESVHPEFYHGTTRPGEKFILCSDGFWRKTNEKELRQRFLNVVDQEETIKKTLLDLIEQNISRGEKDNLSAIYTKRIK